MPTIQDEAAKGPSPYVRPFAEYLRDIRYLLILAAICIGLLLLFKHAITPTHAGEGNHACISCGSPLGDQRSGSYPGNPGGFTATQRAPNTGHTLGQLAASIGNAIGRAWSAIGDFVESNLRYHYEDKPGQYDIMSPKG